MELDAPGGVVTWSTSFKRGFVTVWASPLDSLFNKLSPPIQVLEYKVQENRLSVSNFLHSLINTEMQRSSRFVCFQSETSCQALEKSSGESFEEMEKLFQLKLFTSCELISNGADGCVENLPVLIQITLVSPCQSKFTPKIGFDGTSSTLKVPKDCGKVFSC